MQPLIQKCSSVANISAVRGKGVCLEDDAGCVQTWKKDVFLKVTCRLGSYSITVLVCKDSRSFFVRRLLL